MSEYELALRPLRQVPVEVLEFMRRSSLLESSKENGQYGALYDASITYVHALCRRVLHLVIREIISLLQKLSDCTSQMSKLLEDEDFGALYTLLAAIQTQWKLCADMIAQESWIFSPESREYCVAILCEVEAKWKAVLQRVYSALQCMNDPGLISLMNSLEKMSFDQISVSWGGELHPALPVEQRLWQSLEEKVTDFFSQWRHDLTTAQNIDWEVSWWSKSLPDLCHSVLQLTPEGGLISSRGLGRAMQAEWGLCRAFDISRRWTRTKKLLSVQDHSDLIACFLGLKLLQLRWGLENSSPFVTSVWQIVGELVEAIATHTRKLIGACEKQHGSLAPAALLNLVLRDIVDVWDECLTQVLQSLKFSISAAEEADIRNSVMRAVLRGCEQSLPTGTDRSKLYRKWRFLDEIA